MAKAKTVFSCTHCGMQSPKWMGRCTDCGEWNSFIEETKIDEKKKPNRAALAEPGLPMRLQDISMSEEFRISCGLNEFDRVLGGGIVPGSLILVGGDPGIGKSTLLLQAFANLSKKGRSLYIGAEESPRQIKLRADRLCLQADNLYLLAETSLDQIKRRVADLKPDFLVIDSIQAIYSPDVDASPGGVSQVRECAGQLMVLAKSLNIPTFLVGHVTRDGNIGGPSTLMHTVDVCLMFEGSLDHTFRILRGTKNRFGSISEIGVFRHQADGLHEVANPSEMFLAERPKGSPGSSVVPILEGTRPILIELQALVASSQYGTPQRTSLGFDHKRLSLLTAILERKAGLTLAGRDMFVNVAGGVKASGTELDLAVLMALASSYLDKPIDAETILLGEVGLAGEVRAIAQPEVRIKEAARLGFSRCLLPQGNVKGLSDLGDDVQGSIQLRGIRDINEALQEVFGQVSNTDTEGLM